jgi:hypothetical protein
VELSRTLVEAGRTPGQGNGRPARVERADDRRAQLRATQLAQERRLAGAAARFAEAVDGEPAQLDRRHEPLDRAQVGVLLRMLDLVLAARVAGRAPVPLAAAAHGIQLTLTPAPGRFATVPTTGGALHLDGFTLAVSPAGHTVAGRRQRSRELVPA